MQVEPSAKEVEEEAKREASEARILGAEPDVWLAGLTFFLTLATTLLWLETWRLRCGADKQAVQFALSVRATRESARAATRSAGAAEKTAEAALLSARTAVSIEMPLLILEAMDFMPEGLDQALTSKIAFPRVNVTIRNYGRTAAFIESQGHEIVIGDLPEFPDYSRTAHDANPATILEAKLPLLVPTIYPSALPSEAQVGDIIAGRLSLWVFGYVTYRDFLREPHILRYCKCLLVNPFTNATMYSWTAAQAPAAYTESH